MKILFIMARMGGGGAERVVSELADAFSDSHEVTIITTVEAKCVYNLTEKVKLKDISYKNKGMLSRVKMLHKELKDNDYDIAISFLTGTNIESILAKVGTNKKLIISERNNPYVDPKDPIYRIMRKNTYWMADGFVFQTVDAKNFFSEKIQKKSTVIMNPINAHLPVFKGERTKRVVNVGRLVEQKNQKMFIDAFCEFYRTHKDYVAEIYGEGPLEHELTEYIKLKNMEEKIILKGFSKNILDDIKDASIFAMSSDYEGMSNALIEAVGMGLPCVSTDHPIGGARMTIYDGENGFLVPVGDYMAMSDRMCLLADNSEIFEKISANGEELKEKLSINKISLQWIDYISKVISKEV